MFQMYIKFQGMFFGNGIQKDGLSKKKPSNLI